MQNLHPTPEQIRIAEALFTAMAFESLIRPTVEDYERNILAKHQFKIERRWVDLGMEDRVILERKEVFLLSKDDAQVFYNECYAARDAAGLKVDHPEACPLLTAENLRIDAENALLSDIARTPGLEGFSNAVLFMDVRKQALELVLRALAPFCGNGDDILKRYLATS